MVDRVEQVSDEESIEMARRLAKEEGILCGISCGAAVSGGGEAGARAGDEGQDDRGDSAGFRRTLLEFRAGGRSGLTPADPLVVGKEKAGAVWVIRGDGARCRNGDLITYRTLPATVRLRRFSKKSLPGEHKVNACPPCFAIRHKAFLI